MMCDDGMMCDVCVNECVDAVCECSDVVCARYAYLIGIFLFRFKHVLDNSQTAQSVSAVDLLLNEIRNAIETTRYATSFFSLFIFFLFTLLLFSYYERVSNF